MPLRIGPLWALLIAFVVLMASNAWLKGIFGVGEIATDVPFLLTGLTLFAFGSSIAAGARAIHCWVRLASATGVTWRSWKARAISSSADQAVATNCCAMTARRIC